MAMQDRCTVPIHRTAGPPHRTPSRTLLQCCSSVRSVGTRSCTGRNRGSCVGWPRLDATWRGNRCAPMPSTRGTRKACTALRPRPPQTRSKYGRSWHARPRNPGAVAPPPRASALGASCRKSQRSVWRAVRVKVEVRLLRCWVRRPLWRPLQWPPVALAGAAHDQSHWPSHSHVAVAA